MPATHEDLARKKSSRDGRDRPEGRSKAGAKPERSRLSLFRSPGPAPRDPLELKRMEIGGVRLKDGDHIFGFPDEWAKFQERFPEFLKAFDALAQTMNKVRVRTFIPQNRPADETVFFLSSLVFEDFTEVWVMAGNGLGTGALKSLRGMYERTVTAAYISVFPSEAKRFWAYWSIPHRKLLNHAKELLGAEFLESVLGADHMKLVEAEYQKVKNDFQEIVCQKCSLTRTMFSWSKLGLPAMAKKAGYGLEHCYYNGYAVPTQQAHSTVLALTSRLKLQADGAYTDNSFQKSFAALAVLTAHVLTLRILRVSDVYFSLGLADEIAQREAECKLAWPGVENDCGRGM
jgi:hypothetical protein